MKVQLFVDGQARLATLGSNLAAALAGQPGRCSVSGQPRAALCGMGVCFECRVTIDGQPHQRACQRVVYEGMEVEREH
ncbi:(2Fe-2S)-binding protein [Chitinimonas sp. JJ19]|uniref:(2Fe-2S)-binding protein n=1 Tax=Chitinimonas sp. JJ19 TaxID=3109352 RepID=UPI003003A49D